MIALTVSLFSKVILAFSDSFIELETFEATLLSETFSVHCFRQCLSAIHYNENSDCLQKVTADGRPKYAIK